MEARASSPRRPGASATSSAVTDAVGDEPDVGEAASASSQRGAPGEGQRERNLREGTQRVTGKVSLSAGLASAEARVPGVEARERRFARAERHPRAGLGTHFSRAVERPHDTRGVLATVAADAAIRCWAARKRRIRGSAARAHARAAKVIAPARGVRGDGHAGRRRMAGVLRRCLPCRPGIFRF